MKKFVCLLLTLALCLPLCAVAEEVATPEIDLTGEWYALMSILSIRARMAEAPASVEDLPEEYVSEKGLEGASMVQLSDTQLLFYRIEDDAIAAMGLVMFDTNMGNWACVALEENPVYGGSIIAENEEFIVDDAGISMMVQTMIECYPIPITVLSENVFTYETSYPDMPALYINIRKAWLNALQDAE